MTKIFASLALSAALGAGFAAGAQAQTVSNLGGSNYALQVTTTHPAGILVSPGLYEYSYTGTLLADSIVNVNSFTVGNIDGAIPGAASVTAETPGLDFVAAQPGSTASFTATSGFQFSGDTATFNVFSTLPPTGTVSLTSNGTETGNPSAGNLGSTGSLTGPGPVAPTIPETSSFALLGLGLLPLGIMARRRIARNS